MDRRIDEEMTTGSLSIGSSAVWRLVP